MTAYLVLVQGMSGTVGTQIWYDPPPDGYRDIKVVGPMLPIPHYIQKHAHHGLDTVEAMVLRERKRSRVA